MIELAEAREIVMKVEIRRKQPQPSVVIRFASFAFSSSTVSATAASATSGGPTSEWFDADERVW